MVNELGKTPVTTSAQQTFTTTACNATVPTSATAQNFISLFGNKVILGPAQQNKPVRSVIDLSTGKPKQPISQRSASNSDPNVTKKLDTQLKHKLMLSTHHRKRASQLPSDETTQKTTEALCQVLQELEKFSKTGKVSNASNIEGPSSNNNEDIYSNTSTDNEIYTTRSRLSSQNSVYSSLECLSSNHTSSSPIPSSSEESVYANVLTKKTQPKMGVSSLVSNNQNNSSNDSPKIPKKKTSTTNYLQKPKDNRDWSKPELSCKEKLRKLWSKFTQFFRPSLKLSASAKSSSYHIIRHMEKFAASNATKHHTAKDIQACVFPPKHTFSGLNYSFSDTRPRDNDVEAVARACLILNSAYGRMHGKLEKNTILWKKAIGENGKKCVALLACELGVSEQGLRMAISERLNMENADPRLFDGDAFTLKEIKHEAKLAQKGLLVNQKSDEYHTKLGKKYALPTKMQQSATYLRYIFQAAALAPKNAAENHIPKEIIDAAFNQSDEQFISTCTKVLNTEKHLLLDLGTKFKAKHNIPGIDTKPNNIYHHNKCLKDNFIKLNHDLITKAVDSSNYSPVNEQLLKFVGHIANLHQNKNFSVPLMSGISGAQDILMDYNKIIQHTKDKNNSTFIENKMCDIMLSIKYDLKCTALELLEAINHTSQDPNIDQNNSALFVHKVASHINKRERMPNHPSYPNVFKSDMLSVSDLTQFIPNNKELAMTHRIPTKSIIADVAGAKSLFHILRCAQDTPSELCKETYKHTLMSDMLLRLEKMQGIPANVLCLAADQTIEKTKNGIGDTGFKDLMATVASLQSDTKLRGYCSDRYRYFHYGEIDKFNVNTTIENAAGMLCSCLYNNNSLPPVARLDFLANQYNCSTQLIEAAILYMVSNQFAIRQEDLNTAIDEIKKLASTGNSLYRITNSLKGEIASKLSQLEVKTTQQAQSLPMLNMTYLDPRKVPGPVNNERKIIFGSTHVKTTEIFMHKDKICKYKDGNIVEYKKKLSINKRNKLKSTLPVLFNYTDKTNFQIFESSAGTFIVFRTGEQKQITPEIIDQINLQHTQTIKKRHKTGIITQSPTSKLKTYSPDSPSRKTSFNDIQSSNAAAGGIKSFIVAPKPCSIDPYDYAPVPTPGSLILAWKNDRLVVYNPENGFYEDFETNKHKFDTSNLTPGQMLEFQNFAPIISKGKLYHIAKDIQGFCLVNSEGKCSDLQINQLELYFRKNREISANMLENAPRIRKNMVPQKLCFAYDVKEIYKLKDIALGSGYKTGDIVKLNGLLNIVAGEQLFVPLTEYTARSYGINLLTLPIESLINAKHVGMYDLANAIYQPDVVPGQIYAKINNKGYPQILMWGEDKNLKPFTPQIRSMPITTQVTEASDYVKPQRSTKNELSECSMSLAVALQAFPSETIVMVPETKQFMTLKTAQNKYGKSQQLFLVSDHQSMINKLKIGKPEFVKSILAQNLQASCYYVMENSTIVSLQQLKTSYSADSLACPVLTLPKVVSLTGKAATVVTTKVEASTSSTVVTKGEVQYASKILPIPVTKLSTETSTTQSTYTRPSIMPIPSSTISATSIPTGTRPKITSKKI